MTLIDIAPRTRGRAARVPVVSHIGEVTEADVAALALDRQVKPSNVIALRARHHSLARCLASGMTDIEVSIVTGYTPSRVSILKGDPAVAELITFYQANVNAVYEDLHERMATLSLDVLEEIAARIENEPEALQTGQLLDMFKALADRTGHAPVSKSISVSASVDLGARLSEARKRAGLAGK